MWIITSTKGSLLLLHDLIKAACTSLQSSGSFIPGENHDESLAVFTSRHQDTWYAVMVASAWAHTHFCKHYNLVRIHERNITLETRENKIWFWVWSTTHLSQNLYDSMVLNRHCFFTNQLRREVLTYKYGIIKEFIGLINDQISITGYGYYITGITKIHFSGQQSPTTK